MSPAIPAQPTCPRCQDARLEARNRGAGVGWACAACEGSMVGVGLLQSFALGETVLELWKQVRTGKPGTLKCPACAKPMPRAVLAQAFGALELDGCPGCFVMWFDKGELEKLPATPVRVPPPGADPRAYQSPWSLKTPVSQLTNDTMLELGVSPLWILFYRIGRYIKGQ